MGASRSMTAPTTPLRASNSTLTNRSSERAVEAISRLALVPQVQVAAAATSGLLVNPRNGIRACSLCGSEVSGGPVCRPRLRCEPCARAAYFIAAAVRAIKTLDESRQRQARKALLAAANGLASRKVRGTGGRFVKVSR